MEFVNTLCNHEKSVFRMLRVAASTSKDHEDIGSANTILEAEAKKKKIKLENSGCLGTCNASI